jgi:rhodanese-related sulfurtransferase
MLAQAPRDVETLAALTEQSHANVSQHLQQLRSAGVVTGMRRGKSVVYSLTDEMLVPVYMYLSAAADRTLAEAQRTRQHRYASLDSQPPLSLVQLRDAMEASLVTVIDVRPSAEFEYDHLPGAVSIPVGELSERFAELPGDRTVAAYCRGPHCTYAYEAVAILRANGRRAQRIEGGYLGWRTCQIESRSRVVACPE